MARSPSEDVVYLGDTARVPYGTRSAQTVIRYAQACARRLIACDIKFLVVACNTVSAVALDVLTKELSVPVLGVIEPGASAGLRASRSKKIGVLATRGTVKSNAYQKAITEHAPEATVVAHAAPLLVPLAEEGWVDGEVPALAVRRYLKPLAQAGVDTVVLGCTHYPVLTEVIEAEANNVIGASVAVVDSANAAADSLDAALRAEGLARAARADRRLDVLVTDLPGPFHEVASRFLRAPIDRDQVTQVDL